MLGRSANRFVCCAFIIFGPVWLTHLDLRFEVRKNCAPCGSENTNYHNNALSNTPASNEKQNGVRGKNWGGKRGGRFRKRFSHSNPALKETHSASG